jgi:hypothetical protein
MRSNKRQAPDAERIAKAIHAIPFRDFQSPDLLKDEREKLIGEYLAKKATLIADADERPDGTKVVGPEALGKMNGRQAAGMYLRTYGANALKAFNVLLDRPARRRYQKQFPGIGDLLRKHCPEGHA